jgi:hypothetical protein
MPISDTYVVQYLLQASRGGQESILWQDNGSNGYVARGRDIEAQLDRVPSRAGSRLCLTLAWAGEKVYIEEPPNTGFFRARYESEDQAQLACLLKELAAAAARQCSARSKRSADVMEVVRESVYKHLIGA